MLGRLVSRRLVGEDRFPGTEQTPCVFVTAVNDLSGRTTGLVACGLNDTDAYGPTFRSQEQSLCLYFSLITGNLWGSLRKSIFAAPPEDWILSIWSMAIVCRASIHHFLPDCQQRQPASGACSHPQPSRPIELLLLCSLGVSEWFLSASSRPAGSQSIP
jgi:hypothetical protein